jgi:hypothetical protein
MTDGTSFTDVVGELVIVDGKAVGTGSSVAVWVSGVGRVGKDAIDKMFILSVGHCGCVVQVK